jgi:hypothetical protein
VPHSIPPPLSSIVPPERYRKKRPHPDGRWTHKDPLTMVRMAHGPPSPFAPDHPHAPCALIATSWSDFAILLPGHDHLYVSPAV